MSECTCVNMAPRMLRGVTRTVRITVLDKAGNAVDLSVAREVVVTVSLDGAGASFAHTPGFTVAGDDNNVVEFPWYADEQKRCGRYTIDVNADFGNRNQSRVDFHREFGVELVEHSCDVSGEPAEAMEVDDDLDLEGTLEVTTDGMSAFDQWRTSPESEGYPPTEEGFFAWIRQPATDAATAAAAQMSVIQGRADEDHTRAGQDHTRAESDHGTASSDHTLAAGDHTQAGNDHTTASSDHVTAGLDHTQAASDHDTAAADHTTAVSDHTKAVTDHTTATSDHTVAISDHEAAAADHSRAESDHTTAAADHTQATADHAVMAGFDTRLGNVEAELSQLGNEEDIDQDSNGKLQFANRVYDSQNPDGMGYKILRKNASFASQVTDTNTIYEIRYNFNLGGASVTIPAGCVLKFVGGSIDNGTIELNGTYIDTVSGVAFKNNANVSGMVGNEYVIPDWFGAVGDGLTNDAPAIQKAIDACNKIVGVLGKTYAVSAAVRSHCLIIKRDYQDLTIDLLDLDTYNDPDYRGRGVIFLNALNYFRYRGTITSVNDSIPVSASSGNTLESARGGIVCWGDCGYLDVKMSCSNLYSGISSGTFLNKDYLSRNGAKGVHDCSIDVKAKRIAYPVALNYGNKNSINVVGEEMHRCVYICGDYNIINACGRDYYAASSSTHILLFVNFILENGAAVMKTSNYNDVTYKEMIGETHFVDEGAVIQFQTTISDENNPPAYTHSEMDFVGNVFNVYCAYANRVSTLTSYIFKSPPSNFIYDNVVYLDAVMNIYGDARDYLFRGADIQVEGLKNNFTFNNHTPQKVRFDIRDNNADSIYKINGNQNSYIWTLDGKVYLQGGEVNCSVQKTSEMSGQVYVFAANPSVSIISEYNRKHTHISYFDNYPVRTALLVNPSASQIGVSCFDTQKGCPLYWTGTQWITADGVKSTVYRSGITTYRPSLSLVPIGYIYFDTTLGKSIVSNGSAWVNMDGTPL